MALNNLADLSTTAASNTDFRGQSTAGSALVSTIDTMLQNLGSMLARFYDDIGATGTVAGTADAITLTTTSGFQSLADGLFTSFKAGSANTGAATINVDSLGVKAIRRQGDSALSANDIVANGVYLIRYDTAYNSSAGAWVLLNPTASTSLTAATTTKVLTGTDSSDYATADAIAALWEKGSDIASAGTITIAEGGFFHVTGTTTITDIDWATAKNGRGAWVVFDGALTLTHNATTLKLPGGANITTAANDRAFFIQDASDNVICMDYIKADGTPVVSTSGGMTLLETLTTTSSATHASTVSFSGYKELYVDLVGVSPASNETGLQINGSTNGSAWGTAVVFTSSSTGSSDTIYAHIRISGIDLATDSKWMTGAFTETATNDMDVLNATVLGQNAAGALANIRFTWAGGSNFDAGSIRIYGVR